MVNSPRAMNQQDKPLSKLSGWEEGLHFNTAWAICTTTMCTSTSIYSTPYCAPKLIDWSLGFSWRNDMWMLCLSWHITCINWRQPWLKNAVDVPTRPSACIVKIKYPFPRFSLAGGDLQRKTRVRKSVSASIWCSQSTKEGNICQGIVPGINKVSYCFLLHAS